MVYLPRPGAPGPSQGTQKCLQHVQSMKIKKVKIKMNILIYAIFTIQLLHGVAGRYVNRIHLLRGFLGAEASHCLRPLSVHLTTGGKSGTQECYILMYIFQDEEFYHYTLENRIPPGYGLRTRRRCRRTIPHVSYELTLEKVGLKVTCNMQKNGAQRKQTTPSSTSSTRPPEMVIHTLPKDDDCKFVKLPTLDLPTFSGDYNAWVPFIDQFDSMVGNKTNISDSSKMGYLKRACTGDALILIKRLATNEQGNYKYARQVLMKRYQNKRCIAKTHIDYIVNAQPVKADTGISLRRFLGHFLDNVEGLRQLDIDIDTDDDIFLHYHVMTKLDNDTRRDYEIKHPGTELPVLSELIQFLEDRATALETYSAAGKGKQGGDGPGMKEKTGSFAAQGSDSKKGCLCCKGQHGTFRCEDFAKLSIDQRRKVVKDGDGCFNCMSPGHQVAKCTSKHSCRSPGCGKRHHSMLHV